MSYSEMFELRRQIHELRTDATIMETTIRAYETIIEEQRCTIAELEAELGLVQLDGAA